MLAVLWLAACLLLQTFQMPVAFRTQTTQLAEPGLKADLSSVVKFENTDYLGSRIGFFELYRSKVNEAIDF